MHNHPTRNEMANQRNCLDSKVFRRGGAGPLVVVHLELDTIRRWSLIDWPGWLSCRPGELVCQRSDTGLRGNDARSWSSACVDELLGGAWKVRMCWPPVWGRSSLVRVRYRSPTSGWCMWLTPLG